MRPYDRVYATVNYDALRHNMQSMQQNLSAGTKIIGVVKADGYGHGAVPVAKAIREYVSEYAVATIWEAVNLRENGISLPILVLGATYEGTYDDYLKYDISPTVFSMETAEHLSEASMRLSKKVRIHIKVDTGMSRIGYQPNQKAVDEIIKISHLPGIEPEGIFTHFARADEADKEPALIQLHKFSDFIATLKEQGLEFPIHHCSNSAALIDIKEANLDAVRAGISIYGIYPSSQVQQSQVKLQPVLELKSQLVHVKEVENGTGISYGAAFVTEKTMKVATIPVGYGDGYPRNLSNKGEVLVRGKRAPILGRVCMDQMIIDVSAIPGIKNGDVATLVGTDGSEHITVNELAQRAESFNYEILCNLGKRIPRVYLENGKVIGRKDYFNDSYDEI